MLAVALESGDKESIFWGYYHLGGFAIGQRDYDQAKKYLGEALRVSEDLKGTPRIAALNVHGELARAEGEDERAREYYEERKPAELFINDGRLQANPPLGFTDFSKVIPRFTY